MRDVVVPIADSAVIVPAPVCDMPRPSGSAETLAPTPSTSVLFAVARWPFTLNSPGAPAWT